jgi:hypothetical protein
MFNYFDIERKPWLFNIIYIYNLYKAIVTSMLST